MLYIEEDGLSPRNLSPVFLDLNMAHNKSDGDVEAPPTPSQVPLLVLDILEILSDCTFKLCVLKSHQCFFQYRGTVVWGDRVKIPHIYSYLINSYYTYVYKK